MMLAQVRPKLVRGHPTVVVLPEQVSPRGRVGQEVLVQQQVQPRMDLKLPSQRFPSYLARAERPEHFAPTVTGHRTVRILKPDAVALGLSVQRAT